MAPAVAVSDDKLDVLESSLLNKSGSVSLHDRFRALFTLKALSNDRVVEIISNGFSDSSALLKHELAYVLGQMKNPSALPKLEQVLRDRNEDPMVRHEAAEAIGAIGLLQSLPLLKEYLDDEAVEVRETCEIAVDKILWENSEEGRKEKESREKEAGDAHFTSEDPAPAETSGLIRNKPSSSSEDHISTLQHTLLNTSLPLFTRYRAMFALRNLSTSHPTATDALCFGLLSKASSALFKHEIAFVFGQMLDPRSIPTLIKVLEDEEESDMVRHEAAEALGGIASEECLPVLRVWAKKEGVPRVVKESCVVAIDMWEYENSDQFQYANGLVQAAA